MPHDHHRLQHFFSFFFFNDTATTQIYTLSLHDALPISHPRRTPGKNVLEKVPTCTTVSGPTDHTLGDRKSTRLNSSHVEISYAVFCLKKKKKKVSVKSGALKPPHHILTHRPRHQVGTPR